MSVVLVGLVAVLGFGWVSAQEAGSDGYGMGASYVLKAGDCVTWPSGHSWYLRMTSTSNYPFKVVTTNSSGRAIYAKAPSGGYALYADGRVKARSFQYMTSRTHYFTVGAGTFLPQPWTNNYVLLEGQSYLLGPDAAGCLVADVHLPQGAVITGFRVYFSDTSTWNRPG
jgi:hypothetical protein